MKAASNTASSSSAAPWRPLWWSALNIPQVFDAQLPLCLCALGCGPPVFIPSPLHHDPGHRSLTPAGSLHGVIRLQGPRPSAPRPRSHNPSCDKRVPVRGLNFDPVEPPQTESRGAESWTERGAGSRLDRRHRQDKDSGNLPSMHFPQP